MPYKDRNKRLEYLKQYFKNRLKNNLCLRCGIEITEKNYKTSYHCKTCHDKLISANKRRKLKLIQKGICTDCLKNKIDKNLKAYCRECQCRKNIRRVQLTKVKIGTYIDDYIEDYVNQFEE